MYRKKNSLCLSVIIFLTLQPADQKNNDHELLFLLSTGHEIFNRVKQQLNDVKIRFGSHPDFFPIKLMYKIHVKPIWQRFNEASLAYKSTTDSGVAHNCLRIRLYKELIPQFIRSQKIFTENLTLFIQSHLGSDLQADKGIKRASDHRGPLQGWRQEIVSLARAVRKRAGNSSATPALSQFDIRKIADYIYTKPIIIHYEGKQNGICTIVALATGATVWQGVLAGYITNDPEVADITFPSSIQIMVPREPIKVSFSVINDNGHIVRFPETELSFELVEKLAYIKADIGWFHANICFLDASGDRLAS